MQTVEKSILVLWQDYLFLTTEMEKFLDKRDFDLFLELVSQRERLQAMIESKQRQICKASPPEEQIMAEIHEANQAVMNKLHYVMNMEDKQQHLSRAYDGYSSTFVGIRMDRKS